MGQLVNYEWIVVAGGIAAFVTAYGIGANDLANSFGTTVGSKTLKIWQVVIIASIFEFTGALFLGATVVDTIRGKIAKPEYFSTKPELYMLGMLCADLASAVWLLTATYLELPVSTTHSTVGGVIGFALVAGGGSAIIWTQKIDEFPGFTGVVTIVLSWVTSPFISMLVALFLFLLVRLLILRRKNSFMLGLILTPILVFVAVMGNLWFILSKGAAAYLKEHGNALSDSEAWGWAALGGGIAMLIAIVYFWGYLRTRVDRFIKENDARDARAAAAAAAKEIEAKEAEFHEMSPDAEATPVKAKRITESESAESPDTGSRSSDDGRTPAALVGGGGSAAAPAPAGGAAPLKGRALWERRGKKAFDFVTQGVRHDVHTHSLKDERVQNMHDLAEKFDPKTEHFFSYLQVFTACAMSFSHGANDVANAVGPFSGIFYVFKFGRLDSKTAGMKGDQRWILAMGGAGIVLGLATMGYQILRVIGCKLAMLSPSRGFCAEFASAMTVSFASRYGLPVSTTHCQVGATVGVGVAERWGRGVNWKLFLRVFIGWVFTLIVCGFLSAGLYAQGAFSPSFFDASHRLDFNSIIGRHIFETLNALNTSEVLGQPWVNPAVLNTNSINALAMGNYILNYAYDKKGFKSVQYFDPSRQGILLNNLTALTLAAVPGPDITDAPYKAPAGPLSCKETLKLAGPLQLHLRMSCP